LTAGGPSPNDRPDGGPWLDCPPPGSAGGPTSGHLTAPVKRVYQKRVRDVDDLKQRLVEVWSDFWHTSTRNQIIDVAYALLMHPLMKTDRNFVVNWVYVGAVGQRSGDLKFNSGVA